MHIVLSFLFLIANYLSIVTYTLFAEKCKYAIILATITFITYAIILYIFYIINNMTYEYITTIFDS